MKRLVPKIGLIGFAMVVGLSAIAKTGDEIPPKATMDKAVKPFVLKDVMFDAKKGKSTDDAMIALEKYKGKKNVVLFFMSEGCSVTWRYEKRIGKLMQDMATKDVAFLGMRCSETDSPQSIRKFAETRNFAMPVLNDDKGEVAKFFGVIQTPTFVLIDKKCVMRYRGSFDENADEASAKKPYLRSALNSVMDLRDVSIKQTRVFG